MFFVGVFDIIVRIPLVCHRFHYQRSYLPRVCYTESFTQVVDSTLVQLKSLRMYASKLITVSNRVVTSNSDGAEINGSIPMLMFQSFLRRKDEVILVDAITEKAWTGSQLHSTIAKLGGELMRLGVNKGDVVGFFCSMSDLHAICLLSFISIGALYSGSTPNMSYDDISKKAVASGAKFAVFCKDDIDLRRKLCTKCSFQRVFVLDSEAEDEGVTSVVGLIEKETNHLLEFEHRLASISKSDPVRINFSSGTTGPPKPMTFTHEATCTAVNISAPGFEMVTSNDTIALSNPFVFGSGFHYLVLVMVSGAKGVVFPTFDAFNILRAAEKHNITFIFMLPSLIVKMNEAMKTNELTPKFRKVLTAGEVLFPKTAMEFIHLFKPAYFGQYYGSTEMGFATLKPIVEGTGNIKTVGIPIGGVSMKIVCRQTGELLPPNNQGEIYVKTSMRFREYVNNEAATRASFDPDGYFKTGDIGYYDESGYFYFLDRCNQLLVVRGVEHSISELEAILSDHEAVSEVAIMVVPHSEYGNCPKAFVKLHKDYVGITTGAALDEYFSNRVTADKRLFGGIVFVDDFKRSVAGKIDRRALLMSCTLHS